MNQRKLLGIKEGITTCTTFTNKIHSYMSTHRLHPVDYNYVYDKNNDYLSLMCNSISMHLAKNPFRCRFMLKGQFWPFTHLKFVRLQLTPVLHLSTHLFVFHSDKCFFKSLAHVSVGIIMYAIYSFTKL